MDKEKQIDIVSKYNAKNDLANALYCKQDEFDLSNPFNVANVVINLGYRKINDNEIVISKEEYERLNKLETYDKPVRDRVFDLITEIKEKTRKETAREILELLVPDCKSCDENWHNGCLCLRATLVEKIAKEFGVEIGEKK